MEKVLNAFQPILSWVTFTHCPQKLPFWFFKKRIRNDPKSPKRRHLPLASEEDDLLSNKERGCFCAQNGSPGVTKIAFAFALAKSAKNTTRKTAHVHVPVNFCVALTKSAKNTKHKISYVHANAKSCVCVCVRVCVSAPAKSLYSCFTGRDKELVPLRWLRGNVSKKTRHTVAHPNPL